MLLHTNTTKFAENLKKMDVTIFNNKKIRFSLGAEGPLLTMKNEADVDAIYNALEKAQAHYYNAKSLKDKALAKSLFEIHYKKYRIFCQLHDTFIEVSYILNIHDYPPNGSPVYEAF